MNSTPILSKFAIGQELRLTLTVEVAPGGISPKNGRNQVALQELGLTSDFENALIPS